MCNHLEIIFHSKKKNKKQQQRKTTDAGAQEIPYPIYREIKNVNFYSLEAGLFPDCSPSH